MSITINGTTGVSGVDGSSTAPAFQGTDTDTGLFYSANTVSVSAGGSKVATINAYGIGLGTGVPSSGIGITFPATQSSSSDGNTLDDYEEGTWTPAVTSGFTTPGYGTRSGLYTKIGNIVNFFIFLEVSSGTRAASILTISLPITSKNSSGFAGSASWAYATSGVIGSTSTNLPVLYVNSNSTSLLFYDSNGSNFNGTSLAAATPGFYISGAYLTE
jgi:hypothetical protein